MTPVLIAAGLASLSVVGVFTSIPWCGAPQPRGPVLERIDVQLKRRRDLVPNSVTAVEAYAAHEREMLRELTEARRRGRRRRGASGASAASAASSASNGHPRGGGLP